MSESVESLPTTLLEAIRYFADPEVCVQFVAKMRWPDGPVCPKCEGREHSYLKTRRVWKCKACKKQFSVKAGTIFEGSPIPLDKWLASIWLIANSKNGVSSYELGRSVGLTQKTAWFVLHRIRLAMQTGSFDKFKTGEFDNWDGEIEVDETYIGGAARNMHGHVRAQKVKGTGMRHKTTVVGALQRGGRVRLAVLPQASRRTLHPFVYDTIMVGSTVYTDAHRAYISLQGFDHQVIDHAERYVDGRIHTNGLENFWSLLKRGLHGTYVSVKPYHLFRYLDERAFTFNERHLDDLGRFQMVLRAVAGRRLTYAQLTGR
jgi:transposase-like protein